MMATDPAGFQAQFQEFAFYVGAVLQLLYWLALPVIAIWAVLVFKRVADVYVASLSGGTQLEPSAKKKPIKIEKFVD